MTSVDQLRGISLTQLRYFIRVAERESMTRAAEDLFVAQSAVSSAVAHLEKELGVQLFIRRHAKGLILTPAGRELLLRARQILTALAESLESIAGDARALWGALHVVCFSPLAPFYLPSILTGLKLEHPGLELLVSEAVAGEVGEYLESGRAEVALTYDLALADGIEREVLAEIRPYVALPAGHRLADAPSVHLRDLVEEDMILVDLPYSRDYFIGVFTARGLAPKIQYRSGSYETVRAMVAQHHGYSLLHQRPATDTTYGGGRVVAVPLADDVEPLRVVVAHLGSLRLSRRARAFTDRCRVVVTDVNPG
ncbi:LysR family transcriptional regulator [Mycolicibacterium litorale]|uniref:Probable hydrogen peroxide-inducible genes activator n=1 Tax=Mycolicibacterium litorale TaxID=758802 RepID=A0AAD1IQE9_9MYCO|nr:LysR family transcriptional regulator [Mycolicibacterium litorale]TDY00310.1 LysR family transcriptional regulator [Mycolicibacterium litorale]BBY15858.1 LysR family transcriptional regulator [Mycolicibacterium litorale]